MKSELSALDLFYLVKEFQLIVDAKVEQIYQVGKEELVFVFHVPNTGKKILRVILGKYIYFAGEKPPVPEKPPGFCVFLRKRLKNSRLRSVSQLGFQRVLEFVFSTKDSEFRLIIESFGKGNVVFCDGDAIRSVLQVQDWKDRILRPGKIYSPPVLGTDITKTAEPEFVGILEESDKENVVKCLAIDFGFGGVYSEEVCLGSDVDKATNLLAITDTEKKILFEKSTSLFKRGSFAVVVYKEGVVKDIVPFMLQLYNGLEFKKFDSFNSALDSVLTKHEEKKAFDIVKKEAQTGVDKVSEIITQQENRIRGLEASAEENQKKGEFIYEQYMFFKEMLDEISDLKKKFSWHEVAETIKKHKLIKSVDEKSGDITFEL